MPRSVLGITIISWRNQAISLSLTQTPFNSEILYLTSIAGGSKKFSKGLTSPGSSKKQRCQNKQTTTKTKLELILGPLCLKVPITMTSQRKALNASHYLFPSTTNSPASFLMSKHRKRFSSHAHVTNYFAKELVMMFGRNRSFFGRLAFLTYVLLSLPIDRLTHVKKHTLRFFLYLHLIFKVLPAPLRNTNVFVHGFQTDLCYTHLKREKKKI